LKAALGLTLLVAGVYLLTASGHLDGQDQEYYYRMARSLAREHTFSIEPLVYKNTEIAGARGRDGRFYPQYAPGLPLALSPLVALADSVTHSDSNLASNYAWLHQNDSDVTARILVSYFDIPITALGVGLLVLFLMQLGYPTFAAASVGAAFAVSTFAWPQSRSINAEPLQILLLLIAALLTLKGSAKSAIIAGCALGFAILVKITSGLALPGLLLLPDRHDVPIWRRPLGAGVLIVPVIGAVGIYGWYNYVRFGSIITTGYATSAAVAELPSVRVGNPFIGVFGLLLSSGRGLIWYAPPILAGVASFGRMGREKRTSAVALAAFVGIWVATYACYTGWDSGWGWGPRYLLPVLPFMLAPAAGVLDSRGGRLAFVALCVIGLLIQIPGALVDFMASGHAGMMLFGQTAHEHTPEAFVAWRNFHVTGSEIVRHSALLWHGQIDLAWLTFHGTGLPKITFAFITLFFLTGIALLISVATAPQSREPLPRSPRKE
jgi:hypothetical protein